jgi:hypothetical protein
MVVLVEYYKVLPEMTLNGLKEKKNPSGYFAPS